jgi:hypothetical protein
LGVKAPNISTIINALAMALVISMERENKSY